MATELYDLTVPIFIRNFANLSAILTKGEAFAAERGMPPAELLEARLIDDMAPLPRQVQMASDSAKFAVARLAGVDAPAFPDVETNFAELKDRIDKTVAILKSFSRDTIDGKEDATITLAFPSRTLEFKGRDYVLDFALPNFYFHITTAYALLRHKGVPIGKIDYLGGV